MFGGESGSFQTKWLTAISKKSEIHELNESAFKKLHLKFENEKNIQIKNCNSINELKSGNLHGKYDLISVDNPLGYYGYYEHFDFFIDVLHALPPNGCALFNVVTCPYNKFSSENENWMDARERFYGKTVITPAFIEAFYKTMCMFRGFNIEIQMHPKELINGQPYLYHMKVVKKNEDKFYN